MIKFFDTKRQYYLIKKEVDFALKKVLENGVFIGGKEVENFEKEVAEFCGTKYAIGVNSGTDALYLSLRALEIKPGDEVITTPFTFISTAEVIANLGAKPVFADIEEDFNISPKEIEKKITDKTKAIIPVHLFGWPAKMDEILEIAKKYNLYIIEDAAQAFGSEYKRKKVGSLGDIGCFSFFPTKNLGALGDGGMIVTNNGELAEKLKLLRNHGSSPEEKYKNLILGTNSRLDAIQATVLRVKLNCIGGWIKEKRKIAENYNKELSKIKEIKIPLSLEEYHSFNYYTIRAEKRDELRDYLKREEIETKIYYPIPLYSQPAFDFLKVNKKDFPQTERAAKEVLSLPIYPGFKEQDLVVGKIEEFYKN